MTAATTATNNAVLIAAIISGTCLLLSVPLAAFFTRMNRGMLRDTADGVEVVEAKLDRVHNLVNSGLSEALDFAAVMSRRYAELTGEDCDVDVAEHRERLAGEQAARAALEFADDRRRRGDRRARRGRWPHQERRVGEERRRGGKDRSGDGGEN